MKTRRAWQLKTFLGFLLVVTLVSTLGLVSGIILLLEHLPRIAKENVQAVQQDAESLVHRMELLMNSLLARLTPFEIALPALTSPGDQLHHLLDAVVGDGKSLNALYVISPDGIVEQVGLANSEHTHDFIEMVGSDISTNALYQSVRAHRRPVWSDRYLSLISNNIIVGVGIPVGERVIIGEINLAYLLDALSDIRSMSAESAWIIDRRGELVGDTSSPSQAGLINLLGLPIVQQAFRGEKLPNTFNYRGRLYYVSTQHSHTLNWLFVVKAPAGLDDARIRANLLRTAVSLLSLLGISLLLAPLWAGRLAQPLLALVRYARQTAETGHSAGRWPQGFIVEFNQLSADLERMATAILEREHKASAIFNATPVAMMVCDADAGFTIVDTNQAWGQQFGYTRAEVIGRRVLDMNLSLAKTACVRLFQSTRNISEAQDVWLLHQDGRVLLCAVSAQQIKVNGHRLMIWVMDDVTEKRRNERELRSLNVELEERVTQRTAALNKANHEISEALRNLRQTQRGLIEAGKMAALGELVAGVAHELNTPIGNGLMAASTLHDRVREFESVMHSGLRRSMLDDFVNHARTAAQIMVRNLQRAAELVTSFKQVAVDRASSQRRKFDLREMVQEILITLHPTLKRTPHQVSMQVLIGIELDSYPGPLGQVLTNLINNAVLHAFEGGQIGKICISASMVEADRVRITVSDNGNGIPPELLKRIFNPFVTTRLGRGGTGLGLHISYNVVTNLLGGRLTVKSVEGEGASFEIWLPKQAPLPPTAEG